ncbi:MAG: hypothetical protein HQ536_02295 [Parcubacteria group bacterium]|nr:hypothetical protein [Parcubacteria group bacterium]
MKKCKKCGDDIYFSTGRCAWCKYKKTIKKKKAIKKKRGKIYSEYLREGKELTREKVRIRDGHACQKCGKKWTKGERRLDVHHLDCDKEKSSKYENYKKEQHNMITLCHKCHLMLHYGLINLSPAIINKIKN